MIQDSLLVNILQADTTMLRATLLLNAILLASGQGLQDMLNEFGRNYEYVSRQARLLYPEHFHSYPSSGAFYGTTFCP